MPALVPRCSIFQNDIFRQLRHRLLHKNCTKPLIKIVCAVPSKGEN